MTTLQSITEEELNKMAFDSRITYFIDKSKNQDVSFQALKIIKASKFGKHYYVVWVRDMQGNYKSKEGNYLAVSIASSRLNNDFVKSLKPADVFSFRNVNKSERIKAYKFTLIR